MVALRKNLKLGSTPRESGTKWLLLSDFEFQFGSLVRVFPWGQVSLSQAVKEGGLMSIRDDEAEGGCRDIPHNSLFSLLVSISLSAVCCSQSVLLVLVHPVR